MLRRSRDLLPSSTSTYLWEMKNGTSIIGNHHHKSTGRVSLFNKPCASFSGLVHG
jgi:hypothetical protein